MQNQMKTTLQSKYSQSVFVYVVNTEKFHHGKMLVTINNFRTMDTNDSDEINVDSSPNGDESIEVIDRG